MNLLLSGNNFNQCCVVHTESEICRCLIGCGHDGYHSGNQPKVLRKDDNMNKKFAIRKLTPTECFRLQGMEDKDVNKARAVGVSDSQLYKQAGNGLTSNCIQFIMEHLYKVTIDDSYVTTDERMIENGYGV